MMLRNTSPGQCKTKMSSPSRSRLWDNTQNISKIAQASLKKILQEPSVFFPLKPCSGSSNIPLIEEGDHYLASISTRQALPFLARRTQFRRKKLGNERGIHRKRSAKKGNYSFIEMKLDGKMTLSKVVCKSKNRKYSEEMSRAYCNDGKLNKTTSNIFIIQSNSENKKRSNSFLSTNDTTAECDTENSNFAANHPKSRSKYEPYENSNGNLSKKNSSIYLSQ